MLYFDHSADITALTSAAYLLYLHVGLCVCNTNVAYNNVLWLVIHFLIPRMKLLCLDVFDSFKWFWPQRAAAHLQKHDFYY